MSAVDWNVEQNNSKPRFEPIDRNQVILEPLDIDGLIAPDHPARNAWETLGRLDLSGFLVPVKAVAGHARGKTGTAAG